MTSPGGVGGKGNRNSNNFVRRMQLLYLFSCGDGVEATVS